jgi:hypothetical protein
MSEGVAELMRVDMADPGLPSPPTDHLRDARRRHRALPPSHS